MVLQLTNNLGVCGSVVGAVDAAAGTQDLRSLRVYVGTAVMSDARSAMQEHLTAEEQARAPIA